MRLIWVLNNVSKLLKLITKMDVRPEVHFKVFVIFSTNRERYWQNCEKPENIAAVREDMTKNPNTSIRHRTQELHLSTVSLNQILMRGDLSHAYKSSFPSHGYINKQKCKLLADENCRVLVNASTKSHCAMCILNESLDHFFFFENDVGNSVIATQCTPQWAHNLPKQGKSTVRFCDLTSFFGAMWREASMSTKPTTLQQLKDEISRHIDEV